MKSSTLFFSSLLAAAAMSSVPAWADYTWNGGNEITQALWQTESSWTLSDSSTWSATGTGPGTSYSNMLDGKIVISGTESSKISGTISALEGWTLKLDLKNTLLTVGNLVKFQGGTSITVDEGSVLTINGFSGQKAEGAITLSGAGTIAGKMFFSQKGDYTATVNLENWTGTIKSVDLSIGNLNLSHHGNANSTVELSGFSGYFSEQNDGTVSANIKLTNSSTSGRAYAANITNGWSDKTLTFTGKISGDGTFKNTGPSGSGNSVSQKFLFIGDVSGFAGKFEQSGNRAAGVLMFGNGSAGATSSGNSVSGTGEIAWGNNNVIYDYSNDVVASNTITSAQLVKKGSGSLTLTGTNTYAGGTTIAAGTLVAGSASALGTGTVSVAENAKLSLGTDAVSIGSLSGAGTIGLASGTTKSTLTVNQTTDGTFSGSVNGELVSLVKNGAGTLDLGGYVYLYKTEFANSSVSTTYADVTVNEGTLKISGHAAAGKLSVASSASLGLVGGNAASSFQSVEISEGAKIVIDMSAFADKSETFDVELITTNELKYNDTTITNDNVEATLGGAISLTNWNKTGWKQSLSLDNSTPGTNTLKLTMSIPEPSAFGLLAGVGALAFVAARRRRKKA